jgi:serine/threonine-protein phosphatase 2A regulatory subunit B
MEESNQQMMTPYKFSQCFGDKNENIEVADGKKNYILWVLFYINTFILDLADLISTVQFDSTGDFLASGDRAGRVVLFQRNYSKKSCEYKFYSEFQSHEPEFDYLKSLEINERINKLSWLPRTHNAHFILSTNDKTIKLWKIKERQVQSVLENNLTLSQRSGGSGTASLTLPKVVSREKVVAATPKRIFSSAHAYNIHSISPSSDGEIFISSDDLRINLWNLNSSEIAFNVVDCKPPTIEDLTEVITSATFHPSHGNLFMYSTSRGSLRLCDLRDSALCDQSSLIFGGTTGNSNNNSGSNGFFDEIISSVTDVKFSPSDPNRFISRDYLNTHLWDMRFDSGPLLSLPIHDHIRPRLCDLYENDSVFDKFECAFNHDGSSIISGSYNNYLKVTGLTSDSKSSIGYDLIHADKSIFRNPSALKRTKSSISASTGSITNSASKSTSSLKKSSSWEDFTNLASLDFSKKILHFSTHPTENSVAIASSSNLFIFSQL